MKIKMANSDQINFKQEFSEKLTVHKNINQNVIVTTEDKVKICLMENQNVLTSKNEWAAPFGILISLLATIMTTTFKDTFGFSADTLKAVFIITIILSGGWLLKALKQIWDYRDKGNIQNIINYLKESSKST